MWHNICAVVKRQDRVSEKMGRGRKRERERERGREGVKLHTNLKSGEAKVR